MFVVVPNYYYDVSVLCVGLVCSYTHTVLTADRKLNRPAGTLALYLLTRTPAAATLVRHVVFVVFLPATALKRNRGACLKQQKTHKAPPPRVITVSRNPNIDLMLR